MSREQLQNDSDFQKEKENNNILSFKEIQKHILEFLDKNPQGKSIIDTVLFIENSPQLKNKNFYQEPRYDYPNIAFYTIDFQGRKKIEIFNILDQSFLENLDEEQRKISQKLEDGKNLLLAMDDIFENNSKEFFREINQYDILTPEQSQKYKQNGLNLDYKNLRDLQKIFRENLNHLESIKSLMSPSQEKFFIVQQKKYLEMFMGVGDKYEGGATFLIETQKKFEKITENIIQHGSLTDAFIYMAKLHQEIDNNNWQSQSVENSYKILINNLSEKLFERLKKEKASDEYFVNFSKLLTGRKIDNIGTGDIDDKVRNPELATKALYEVFTRQGGAFEKMGIKNIDPNLEAYQVEGVFLKLKNALKHYYNDSDGIIYNHIISGYTDLKQSPKKKYEELDFQNQAHLSYLNNIAEKIIQLGQKGDTKNTPLNEVISEQIQDTIKNTQELVEKKFLSSDNFFATTKKAEDFGLTGVNKEAYNLFVDMNGIGLMDWSDQSVEHGKTVGKIGAGLVAMVIAASLTGGMSLVAQGEIWGVAAQGAILGALGSTTGLILIPQGFDTIKEAKTELGSDYLVNSLTGGATGWAVGAGLKVLGHTSKNAIIMGGAETAVGIGTEILRMDKMQAINPIHDPVHNNDWSEIEKFYQQQKQ